MKHTIALFFFGICLSLSSLYAQQNVLLIIADDMGTDYCGFYDDGLDTAKMPNIRSLLARGVRFRHAWSFPICSPARASMLTGRFPFRTGVGTVITSADNGQLDTSEISIGKILKQASPALYGTANIGKWHLNISTPANRNNPSIMGFDHYAGNFIGQINDYYNWTKIVDGAPPVTVTNYATTEQVNDAIAWLESLDANQPFFLWQAFNAPHSPFHMPPDSLHTVPGLTGTTQDINQHPEKYYKAMIEAMDTETGRLLHWLEVHGKLDSTNIIFIGDNGDDARITQFPNTNRTKSTIYENGVHVPMIIAGPAVQSPNRQSDALVSTADLFATILELSGQQNWAAHIPADKPVDAVSLVPILKNATDAVHSWVFTEIFDPTHLPDDGKAIRDTDYKLLHFDDGHEEFYQIANDPDELNNLLLSLPLSAEAQSHYHFLCNALGTLLGTAACTPSVQVQDLESNLLQAFPNPATDFLRCTGIEEPGEYRILDVLGNILESGPASIPTLELNVSAYPCGLYFLEIKSANTSRRTGFVKE